MDDVRSGVGRGRLRTGGVVRRLGGRRDERTVRRHLPGANIGARHVRQLRTPRQRTSDYPWGQSAEDLAASLREIEQGWGGPVGRAIRAPSAAHDERFMRFWASYLVQSASPQAALTLARMNAEIDVRPDPVRDPGADADPP